MVLPPGGSQSIVEQQPEASRLVRGSVTKRERERERYAGPNFSSLSLPRELPSRWLQRGMRETHSDWSGLTATFSHLSINPQIKESFFYLSQFSDKYRS